MAPRTNRLPLLPSGPDGVHGVLPHRTRQLTKRCKHARRRGRDLNPRELSLYELSRPAHSARLCDLSELERAALKTTRGAPLQELNQYSQRTRYGQIRGREGVQPTLGVRCEGGRSGDKEGETGGIGGSTVRIYAAGARNARTRVCESMREYYESTRVTRVCESSREYARVHESMREFTRVCESMREYARARVHESMREFTRVYESSREYARVYESMREFTLKINAIVSINSWAADVREAYGVIGAGQVCVTEE